MTVKNMVDSEIQFTEERKKLDSVEKYRCPGTRDRIVFRELVQWE